ncbi:UNKNOWN [Stylonychia lemnae]|uniref:Oxysterol-binding protein n=1 Tax=Stylonychia lemnae TaxID=5949 RepID=A0A077ZU40_STYLE|nr:UNKNOWN [Stylonychia lemnae]|eukprot:CDW73094.1 UNKNOWN [Stylonychia lemnae]
MQSSNRRKSSSAVDKQQVPQNNDQSGEGQAQEENQFPRHRLAHKNGGIVLIDEGNVIPQAFKELLSKIGKKILKGEFSDLLKTPAPAYMHYPRTYLQGSAKDLSLAPLYFKKAAEATDPIERLKWVVATYIGGHHINVSQMQCRAPLNPILGETVQRVLLTGERYYAEQTSHHPPITSFMLEDPNNLYTFTGYFEMKAWPTGLSSLNGSRTGNQQIKFHDGGQITIKDPIAEISGLTYGDRIHNYIGRGYYIDTVNNIEAEVVYNPKDESEGFFSRFWGSKKSQLTDIIQVRICKVYSDGAKQRLATGFGSWLSHLEFDGQIVWKLDDKYDEWLIPSVDIEDSEQLLPSDSHNRPDLQPLIDRAFEVAEKNKVMMEELQRHDKKLRLASKAFRDKKAKQ